MASWEYRYFAVPGEPDLRLAYADGHIRCQRRLTEEEKSMPTTQEWIDDVGGKGFKRLVEALGLEEMREG